MDCSLPGFSAYGILRTRILEWVACSPPGDLPNSEIKPSFLMSTCIDQPGSLPLVPPVKLSKRWWEVNNYQIDFSVFLWNSVSLSIQFSSVQSLSHVRLFATPWIAARQPSLSITNFQSSPKLISIESGWCHPAISSSVVPFSSCPQSLPASGSFPMSQLFTWSGQSIGVSKKSFQRNPRADLL